MRLRILHVTVNLPSAIHRKVSLFLSDWESNPLTVADIMMLRLNDAQFIYLSACHTANNRVSSLLDEGIHLAGACQLTGFPYIVGTLWQIHDEHSVMVAKHVYDFMLDDSGRIDVARSAIGLHNATRRSTFRQENLDDPLVWSPYVHLGML